MITQSPRCFECHQTLMSRSIFEKTVFSYIRLQCVYKFNITEFLKFEGLLGCLATEGLVARQNLKHVSQNLFACRRRFIERIEAILCSEFYFTKHGLKYVDVAIFN